MDHDLEIPFQVYQPDNLVGWSDFLPKLIEQTLPLKMIWKNEDYSDGVVEPKD